MNNNIFNILNELHIDDNDDSENESVNDWIAPHNNESSPCDTNSDNYETYVDIGNYINKKKTKVRKEKHKHKHMLCKNIISKNTCHYGSKCLYAHSLEEQKMSDIRKKTFQLIRGELDATTINIYVERDLYKILLSLCDMCERCEEGKCTGGYNCREGACDSKYVVCRVDLNNGACENKNCKKVHLTKMGLTPYFKYILDSQKDKQSCYDKDSLGTLLTADFFKKLKIPNSLISLENYSTDTDDDSDMDDSNFEGSIFEVEI